MSYRVVNKIIRTVLRTYSSKHTPNISRLVRSRTPTEKTQLQIAAKPGLAQRFRRVTTVFPFVNLILKIKTSLFWLSMEKESEEKKLNFDARPPDSVRGMKTLDREAFKRTVNYPALVIPKRNISKLNGPLKKKILHLRKIKPPALLNESDPLFETHKLLLFDSKLITKLEDFSETEREVLKATGVDFESFQYTEVELEYDNWPAQDVLRAILPENLSNVSGFETVGHIAHLNLRDEVLEYKHIIGEVLVDKIPTVRTVVNKLDMIDNTYRNFEMELLAGENNMVTAVRENGLTYEFDFSKVFWNGRLGTEHDRIVTALSPGDVVYDVFAGVGPFAVPAGKKGVIVYANDLNPHSYESLKSNVTKNKVKKGEVHSYNLDGREFIKSVVKKDMSERWTAAANENSPVSLHVLMNLPALAVEFLDAFKNLHDDDSERPSSTKHFPIIHCYCFSKSEDVKKDAKDRVESVLGEALPPDHKIRVVRDVAPNKLMLCVTFQMTESVLFGTKQIENETGEEPAEKKLKLDS